MKQVYLLTILFFLFLCFTAKVLAQDTLRFLNGNTLVVEIKKVTEEGITFSEIRKGKKSFQTRQKADIFSYKMKNQKEEVVYKFDPSIGNIYNIEEMQDFMNGGEHAEKFYKSWVYNIGGLIGGAAAGYFIADDGAPIIFATPLVLSSIFIIPGASVKKNPLNADLRSKGAYRHGYKRVANGKKFLGMLKYSALGMLASYAVFELTD